MLALLYKKINLPKVDNIHNQEIGKMMHVIYSGNAPDNFKRLFTSLNQIHSYATRSTARAAFFWQVASSNRKRSWPQISWPKNLGQYWPVL